MKSRITFIFLSLSLLLFGLGCGGKKEPAKPQELTVEHFTRSKGLPEENIRCMAGFANQVWAGSDNGLFTFDGVNWKLHVRQNTNVLGSNIIEDLKVSDNALWIATDNGAARFDGRSWSSVFTGGRARSAAGHSGQVAVATAHGVEYNSGGTFQAMARDNAGLVNDEVTQILYDSRGQLWVGTRAGMARLSSGMFQTYTGPAKSIMGSSLIEIPPSPANCQLIGNNVKVLMEYRGLVAVGTTSGLTVTDFNSSYISYYSTHKDWAQRDGRIIEERVDGNSPLPGNVICSLATTPGGEMLFVGTDKGLAILKGSNWLDLTNLIKGLPKTTISGLAYVGADLWIGTDSGIYRVKDVGSLMEKTADN